MKLSVVMILSIGLSGLGVSGLLNCGQSRGEESADTDTVKVIFVELERREGSIQSQGLNGVELTQDEINSLASQNVRGVLKVVGASLHGSRQNPKPRRLVIVMQHQIDGPVELRQPSKSNAIYLQAGDEWKLLPSGTPTSDRKIRLEINQDYKNQTMYWFQLPDGSMQGKTAFSW
ncbi:MAG TPA: hypothetical protein VJT50_01790 [Pyrinomonadaceae bacterium]|nr:hypothetical protein [Pyrinomonadaceae bacterium]